MEGKILIWILKNEKLWVPQGRKDGRMLQEEGPAWAKVKKGKVIRR